MKLLSNLIEDCCLICEPEEKTSFIEDLENWIKENNTFSENEAAREFCFWYCLKNKKERKETIITKRKRGGTIYGESNQDECINSNLETQYLSSRKKSEREKKILRKAISNCFFISNLENEDKETIIQELIPFFIPKGMEIIKTGVIGEFFALIYHGLFKVNRIEDPQPIHIRSGDLFGEIALLYQTPRTATITSQTDSIIFCINRNTFKSVVIFASEQRRILYKNFLKEIPLFSKLSIQEISTLVEALKPIHYKTGNIVVKQGDDGDCFFIIKEGEAFVLKKEKEVAILKRGNWFGEITLIKNCARTATIKAKTELTCLRLERYLFLRLLGEKIKERLDFV